MTYTRIIATLILAAITAAACVPVKHTRQQTAARIATPAFMIDRQLKAGDFTLTLYERIHSRGNSANLYIEGDNAEIGIDPTPKTPIALQLAARDKAENVIYIARPCQYSNRPVIWKEIAGENETCDKKYATTHRFDPIVITAYNEALDEIKRRWDITSFNLYGHSGGGTIAALLATKRSDILSLTTVAGNLDHAAYSNSLRLSQKAGDTGHFISEKSLNARDIARKLNNLPQYHYIGGADTVMPPATLHSYLSAAGRSTCLNYKIIEENGYTQGWVDKWPDILKDKPTCQ